MAICGGITTGAAYDCDNPLQTGMNSRIWLANRNDIDSVTYGTNNSVITAITMKAGGKAFYVFDGFRQSANAQTELVQQTVATGYNHMLTFSVFDISSLQKLNLEKMMLGKMVGIVENVNAAGNSDSVFELFGYGVGMEGQTLTRINRDTESGGSFQIELMTSDNEGKEAKLPLSFWDTDYPTTLAKVVALETPTA